MVKEDLKEGECYVTVNDGDRYIFIAKGDSKAVPYLCIRSNKSNSNNYGQNGCLVGASFSKFEVAESDEREHLEACIVANKYVDTYEKKLYAIY